jgi:glycine/D-amino acid oxidase-like deaminating enzyme
MTPASVWHDGVDTREFPALQGDAEVDLAVIGGGLVGLTTGLLARREGLRVAVLEARRIGSGTTGGTTGKVTAQHGARYAALSRRHGEEGARLYAQANIAGMKQIVQLVEGLELDCDLTTAPSLVYTRAPDQRQSLEEEATAAQAANLPATFTTDTDLPFSVEAAVRFDDQLHLHPLRLVDGLAQALVASGGQVFEHTRVHELEEHDDHVDAEAQTGTVSAANVVVATLLPFGLIGGYFARTRPRRSFGLAARLRSPAPESLTISIDSPTHSTRPWIGAVPHGLIVVGGDHETGTKDGTAMILSELVDWTRANFEVDSIEHSWSAQDYSTPDLLPYIGASPTSKNVLVATGFDNGA